MGETPQAAHKGGPSSFAPLPEGAVNRARSTVSYEILRWLLAVWFRLAGWRSAGETPTQAKFVAIGAPHSSNWDFLVMLAIMTERRVRLNWMGKASLFRFPFGGIMRRLGGIAVQRDLAHGVVGQMVGEFEKREGFALALSPEGTRKKVERWKTGFHRIAMEAGVPIVLGYIDHSNKIVGVGPVIHPSGDVERDLAEILAFYAQFDRRK